MVGFDETHQNLKPSPLWDDTLHITLPKGWTLWLRDWPSKTMSFKIREYSFQLQKSTRIIGYDLKYCMEEQKCKHNIPGRSPRFSKSRRSKNHVEAFTSLSAIRFKFQNWRLRLARMRQKNRCLIWPTRISITIISNSYFIRPKTLPRSIWDVEPHMGHSEFLTICSQLMHNRASLIGIAGMLEDSTSDTSTPKAFKSLSTILTSFRGRSHISGEVILFSKFHASILLGFASDYGTFAGVFDFSSV